MRFLLDTNVLSEPARPQPSERVLAWLGAQSPLDLALSVLTLGEIQRGVSRLATGDRRERLERWLEVELPRRFEGRVLGITEDVAREWGRLSAAADGRGRPLPVIDGLLLATAAVHRLTFVTRNVKDCRDRGVPLLNPWAD
ncbi:MAG: type II toxin-antitoxin system VapC family toxin [Gemmatimonadetes bacterium]|nr:type II toxin-antitoxin system VapC family toxin [Gemmatimonadota bacterium]